MFKLKPSVNYPELCSEERVVLKRLNGYWSIKEYYGACRYLKLNYWKGVYGESYPEVAFLEKSICIPSSLKSVYVLYIYKYIVKKVKNLKRYINKIN